MENKTVDQVYVDNLYAEISRLTRRAIEAETLLEFERSSRPTSPVPESDGDSEVTPEESHEAD